MTPSTYGLPASAEDAFGEADPVPRIAFDLVRDRNAVRAHGERGPRFWYLATPYSKFPGGLDLAAKAASLCAGILIAERVWVFSPIAHSHPIAMASALDPPVACALAPRRPADDGGRLRVDRCPTPQMVDERGGAARGRGVRGRSQAGAVLVAALERHGPVSAGLMGARRNRVMHGGGRHVASGMKCHWCPQSMTMYGQLAATRDHVVSRSRGGVETVWACAACNVLKADMSLDHWRLFCEEVPDWWRATSRLGRKRLMREWRKRHPEVPPSGSTGWPRGAGMNEPAEHSSYNGRRTLADIVEDAERGNSAATAVLRRMGMIE